MKTYRITVTLPDGSQDGGIGIYSDGFNAVIDAMTNFPTAKRISARRISV